MLPSLTKLPTNIYCVNLLKTLPFKRIAGSNWATYFFIRNTLKHLHLSTGISNHAICTLKMCADVVIRQIESDVLDNSVLHL